jgi:tetratricopeptide (TPR) repeat protein
MILFSQKTRGWAALLFVVLGVLVYWNTLEGPFVFDDLNSIRGNTALQIQSLTLDEIWRAAFKGHSPDRPVAYLSFGLNYYVHGFNVVGYHATNMAMHILTGILLYCLIMTTLNLPSVRGDPLTASLTALFAALLWLVNPIQTQSVSYVVQRMNSMSAMFYILSLFLYARGRLATLRQTRWACFVGCIFAGMFALGSKQIAATLPFFILLYEWYFFQDLGKGWLKRILPYLIGMLVLGAGLVFLYLGSNPFQAVLGDFEKNWDFTPSERVLTEFRVVMHYISLLLFPHPSRLNLDYDFGLSHSLMDPLTTLFCVSAIIGLLGLAVYLGRKERVLSFCILWFFGNLVIESSILPLDLVFEHRTYLPSMLFFLPVSILACRYVTNRWMAVGAMSLLILVSCFWTVERNRVWTDSVALWQDCVDKSPNKARSRVNLANVLLGQGRPDEAIAHYDKALELDPDHYMAHISLGAALVRKGRLDEAILHYVEALRIKPKYFVIHHSLGIAYTRKGEWDKAVLHYRKALRLNPKYVDAYTGLGVVLAKQGKVDEAIVQYKKALELKPDDKLARRNLSRALARRSANTKEQPTHGLATSSGKQEEAEEHNMKGLDLARQGKLAEAIASFSRALGVEADYAEAYFNRGMALAGLGRRGDAEADYVAALRVKPDYAEAHNNLGIILAGKGNLSEAKYHFSRALEARPEFEQARQNLQRAERLLEMGP